MNIVWRAIDYENVHKGLYEVSSSGEVRRVADTNKNKAGSLVKQNRNTKGYPSVGLKKQDGSFGTVAVHRIVAAAFLGDSNGFQVNHKDGDKGNNSAQNLEYVTNKENSRHAVRLGIYVEPVVVFGETLSLVEATEKYSPPGLSADRVRTRVQRNKWSLEEALTTPALPTGVARGQRSHRAGG
jgi:hypothetical protein